MQVLQTLPRTAADATWYEAPPPQHTYSAPRARPGPNHTPPPTPLCQVKAVVQQLELPSNPLDMLIDMLGGPNKVGWSKSMS